VSALSRTKVLEDDDSAMTVKTALSLINRVWEEIENELDTNFDAETQVALAWFATFGFDSRASGELITQHFRAALQAHRDAGD
jgi:putative DNA methylase